MLRTFCFVVFFCLLTNAAFTTTTIAYVVNYSGSDISICPVNLDGTFGTCIASNPGGIFTGHYPANIVLNSSKTVAYITLFDNFSGDSIAICPVNPDGTFGTPCTISAGNGTFDQPNGIAISSCGNFLYVANGGLLNANTTSSSVSSCRLFPNGTLGYCTYNSPVGPLGSDGIALTGGDGTTLAYITNIFSADHAETGTGAVTVCPVTVGGVLVTSACTQYLAGDTLDAPIDIVINDADTDAYISNFGNDTVSICPVNSDGSLGPLCTTSTGSGTIEGIADMFIYSALSLLYIANNDNNTVSVCPIEGDGSLGVCAALFDATFNVPNDIYIVQF